MALYAYRCPLCDEEFEVRLPMGTAPEQTPCPSCGHPETTRIFGAATPKSASGGCAAPPPPGSRFT